MLQPSTPVLRDHAGSYTILPPDLTPLAKLLGGMSRAVEFKAQMHEQVDAFGYSPDPLDWELRLFGNGALLLVQPDDIATLPVRTFFGYTGHHTPESLTYGLNLVVTENLMREFGDAERDSLWAVRTAIVDCITGMARLKVGPQLATPALWFDDAPHAKPANYGLVGHPHARDILNLAGCAEAF